MRRVLLLLLGACAPARPAPSVVPVAPLASPALVPAEAPKPSSCEVVASFEGVRLYPSANLLRDGRVLIAGGSRENGLGDRADAWLFDPATRAVAKTSPMLSPRGRHSGVTLRDGRVFIGGGAIEEDEVFDPKGGRWIEVGKQDTPSDLVVALLPDGAVFTGGGDLFRQGFRSVVARRWEPMTGRWSELANAPAGIGGSAVVLPDRRLAMVGVRNGAGMQLEYVAMIYDAARDAWSEVETLGWEAPDDVGALVTDVEGLPRTPLVYATDEGLLVQGEGGRWRSHRRYNAKREGHASVLLDAAHVAIVGADGASTAIEICPL